MRMAWRKIALGLMLASATSAQGAKPVALKPAGNPGDWISPDDYPPEALRANQTGITGFRLDVDPAGQVVRCTVTSSSGSSLLDETSCALLIRRARFSPALDRKGRAIASSFSSAVRWSIPVDADAPPIDRTSCISAAGGDIQVITPEGCQH